MSVASRTILLLGGNGQVGWELRQTLAPLGAIVARDRTTLDLADFDAIRHMVKTARPDVIVNAAAYTQVDRAESEPELARRINTGAPAVLAEAARSCGAVMIHYSTDYVFDGTAAMPYRETDPTNPRNVYGRTKCDGDAAILASGAMAYLFRVGWVYGGRGRNFLRTIQRRLADGAELRVVADQFGAPTWSRAIADATTAALDRILNGRAPVPAPGLYHMAAPDYTTWAGFAQAIADADRAHPHREVTPITSAEFPTAARRPPWSVLDATLLGTTFDVRLPPWRDQLADYLASHPAEMEH